MMFRMQSSDLDEPWKLLQQVWSWFRMVVRGLPRCDRTLKQLERARRTEKISLSVSFFLPQTRTLDQSGCLFGVELKMDRGLAGSPGDHILQGCLE